MSSNDVKKIKDEIESISDDKVTVKVTDISQKELLSSSDVEKLKRDYIPPRPDIPDFNPTVSNGQVSNGAPSLAKAMDTNGVGKQSSGLNMRDEFGPDLNEKTRDKGYQKDASSRQLLEKNNEPKYDDSKEKVRDKAGPKYSNDVSNPNSGNNGLNKRNDLEKKDSQEDSNKKNKSDNGEAASSASMANQNQQASNSLNKDTTQEGSKRVSTRDSKTDSDTKNNDNQQNKNGRSPGQTNRNGQGQKGDVSANARKNLAHRNQMNGTSRTTLSKKTSSGLAPSSSSGSAKPSLASRLKGGLDKLRNRKKPKSSAAASGIGRIGKDLFGFIAKNPFIAITIGVVILILLMLLISEVEDFNGKRKGSTHCTYSLSGVVSTGEIELSNLKVELINCDGTESNYTVLETIDFEKYVLGVSLAEIGPDASDEALKAQIVAARGFSLTRNSGMCPSNQDNCFYGYNVSTGKIRMRACEADQVYWDYEKDIYREDRGSISLYSPEITSGTLWKSALSDTRKEEVLKIAESVKGKVLVDTSGNVVSTNYASNITDQFSSLASEGKTYDEILATVYTDSDGFGDSYCTSYGNIDYGDYVLSSDGHEILHEPLDSFLSSQGTSLEEFNELIKQNVDDAGYGTRAGVVAAAVTLIAELGNNYNVKVPYYWGGGHADGVVDGALGYWGSTQCHTYANGQSYNYCGLDCSGFVPWAIKNGGFNIAQMLAGQFQGLSGASRVSLSNSAVLEPGDLLESSSHIVLVVGVEDNNYICAEASGNSAGVLFTRRPFNQSGYWGVKMDGFYETHARSQ